MKWSRRNRKKETFPMRDISETYHMMEWSRSGGGGSSGSSTMCSIPEHKPPSQEPSPVEEVDPWSPDNFAAMAELWKLSEEDQCNMRTLQDRLSDVDHWKNDPFEVVRFYKELKGNMRLTEEKFRKMVFWRMEHRVDSFMDRYGAPDPLFDYYPSVILRGYDKEQDPIYLERFGSFDAYGFYKHFGIQGVMDYTIFKRERDVTRLPNGSGWQRNIYEREVGRRVARYTVLFDMEDLTRNHLRAGLLPMYHKVARMTQDYYVGVAKRILVLRAPPIFKLFWSLVKHFLDPAIVELVTFTDSSDYLQVLDRYVDREVLPPSICPVHGKGSVMPEFEQVVMEGGTITDELKERVQQRQTPSPPPQHDTMTSTLPTKVSSSQHGSDPTEATWIDYSTMSLMDDLSAVDFSVQEGSNGCRVVSGVLVRGSYTGAGRKVVLNNQHNLYNISGSPICSEC